MSTRYLFFALDSPFSRPVLQTLLDARHPPDALILPNPDRTAPPIPLPLLSNFTPNFLPLSSSGEPTLAQIAAKHKIPILTIGSFRHSLAIQIVRNLHPDLFVTVCFPRLIPPDWLAIPRGGSLNLHPSLLPAYRGLEPLFWQFFFGETRTGVTLHFMDEKADTGDIISQAAVTFPDGITIAEAETLLAKAGGELVRQVLSQPHQIPRTPQPEAGASYHSHPTSEDLIIPTTWAARRAYNFLRAAWEWGPFEIVDHASSTCWRVQEALRFAPGRKPDSPAGREGAVIWVQFADGAVQCMVSLAHTRKLDTGHWSSHPN